MKTTQPPRVAALTIRDDAVAAFCRETGLAICVSWDKLHKGPNGQWIAPMRIAFTRITDGKEITFVFPPSGSHWFGDSLDENLGEIYAKTQGDQSDADNRRAALYFSPSEVKALGKFL